MKNIFIALALGLAWVVVVLWGLGAASPAVVQARQPDEVESLPLSARLPAAQGGTGSVRVASTGQDVAKCGSVALPCQTVQFAVDQAKPGDEILIAGGKYVGVQTRNGVTQTVYIDKPLTLRGGYTTTDKFASSNPRLNPTTLDAQKQGRVIFITDTMAATVENLTLTRGIVDGLNLCSDVTRNCGGGIFATGPLTLINVTITNNFAERFGGGVAALTTTVVTGGQFTNNATGSGFGQGGGLYAEGPTTINSARFTNNSADVGGGVRVTQQSLTINNSRFEQNSSRVGGGVSIGVTSGNVQILEINDSTFIDNSATCQSSLSFCNGGGVSAFDLPVTIVDSHFENNRVQDLFDNDDGNGGGLYLSRAFNTATLTLVNTDFISNRAQINGGGAYASDQALVTGGRFERNAAGGNDTAFSEGGGGLRALSAVVSGTQFIQNSSDENGAGIHVTFDADISNAQFQFNRAITDGGGIYVDFGGTLSLTDTQFISNSAGMRGGGAYASRDAQVTGGRFERNRADGPENDGAFLTFENGGGGLWVGNNLTSTDAEFSANVAKTNGGGAHVRGRAVLNGGQFEQNQSLGNFVSSQSYGGGGLYVATTLAFTDTIFSDNQAAFLGGGVWASQNVSGLSGIFQNNTGDRAAGGLFTLNNLTLTGTQFIRNEADLTGGGALVNGTANLSDTLFQANRVVSTSLAASGGGLTASDGFTATNTQFISNTATGRGGGASVAFGSVDLNNVLFDSNTSHTNGGGLSASFDPVVSNNTSFINNTADANGGGLSSSGNIYLTGSLVQINDAITNGGGLNTNGSVFMTDTQVISNTAGANGGGIWANSGLNGTGGRIESNRSGGSGGGYYGRLAGINLDGVAFAGNQAGGDGGGAYAFDGRAIGQAVFEGNTAAGAGGGLFLQRFAHITASQFLGNAANLGGGLAVSRPRTGTFVQFVHNSLFARNRATSGGSGLYWNQPRPVDLIHNTVASPTLAPGAAIQIVTGTVNISNSLIASHTTGIEVIDGAVTESYNLFSGNAANTSGPVAGGLGSVTGNPAFRAPANDDYHLTATSAAINAGLDAGLPLDFEGDIRPQQGGVDIGYDESPYPTPAPLLRIRKTSIAANGDDLLPGERLTYTLVVSNVGTAPASGVVVSDTLPASTGYLPGSISGGDARHAGPPALTWTISTLPLSTPVALQFAVAVNNDVVSGTQIANTASVTSTEISTPTVDTVTNTVIELTPRLAISKWVTPTSNVVYRGAVTYAVVLSNSGSGDAASTYLTDTLPAAVDFGRWVERPAGAEVVSDTIAWQGTITAGQALTFTFVASHTGSYSDVVTNTAVYALPPAGAGSSTAIFTVEVEPVAAPPPPQLLYLPLVIKGKS